MCDSLVLFCACERLVLLYYRCVFYSVTLADFSSSLCFTAGFCSVTVADFSFSLHIIAEFCSVTAAYCSLSLFLFMS